MERLSGGSQQIDRPAGAGKCIVYAEPEAPGRFWTYLNPSRRRDWRFLGSFGEEWSG